MKVRFVDKRKNCPPPGADWKDMMAFRERLVRAQRRREIEKMLPELELREGRLGGKILDLEEDLIPLDEKLAKLKGGLERFDQRLEKAEKILDTLEKEKRDLLEERRIAREEARISKMILEVEEFAISVANLHEGKPAAQRFAEWILGELKSIHWTRQKPCRGEKESTVNVYP